MDNLCQIIDLSRRITERNQRISMSKLDMMASTVILEKCMVYLNMNNIKELESVKLEITNAIKILTEKSK